MAYLFFGALSTAVNYCVYMACSDAAGLSAITSNVIAWAAAVIFAFITNKLFVFHSKIWQPRKLLPEAGKFLSCRIASGIMETSFLWLTVDIWCWPNLVMKTIASVAVVIANYFASKFYIFTKQEVSDVY